MCPKVQWLWLRYTSLISYALASNGTEAEQKSFNVFYKSIQIPPYNSATESYAFNYRNAARLLDIRKVIRNHSSWWKHVYFRSQDDVSRRPSAPLWTKKFTDIIMKRHTRGITVGIFQQLVLSNLRHLIQNSYDMRRCRHVRDVFAIFRVSRVWESELSEHMKHVG